MKTFELRRFENEIRKIGLEDRKPIDSSDLVQSKYEILGIRAPKLKNFRYEMDFEFKLYIAKNSNLSEAVSYVLMRISELKIDQLLTFKNEIAGLSIIIENWWHSDALSSIYARILEIDRSFLEQIKAWSNSENPWERRQSMVSLLYYSSLRKNILDFDTLISFCIKNIDDENYYVQKGLGWTIREIYNVYPEKTLFFLKNNIERISSHALQASTEKLSKEVKFEIMEIRKNKRK